MTSHQWAISVIKIKTVGSCTIFLFCLVDLFFLFFLLVLRAYRKTGRSVAATNPFKDFPKSFGCFVGEAKRRTLAVLLSLISSLGIQTQMPCSTFPFHLAAAKMQWRELCIMFLYVGVVYIYIRNLDSVRWVGNSVMCREKVLENNNASKGTSVVVVAVVVVVEVLWVSRF